LKVLRLPFGVGRRTFTAFVLPEAMEKSRDFRWTLSIRKIDSLTGWNALVPVVGTWVNVQGFQVGVVKADCALAAYRKPDRIIVAITFLIVLN